MIGSSFSFSRLVRAVHFAGPRSDPWPCRHGYVRDERPPAAGEVTRNASAPEDKLWPNLFISCVRAAAGRRSWESAGPGADTRIPFLVVVGGFRCCRTITSQSRMACRRAARRPRNPRAQACNRTVERRRHSIRQVAAHCFADATTRASARLARLASSQASAVARRKTLVCPTQSSSGATPCARAEAQIALHRAETSAIDEQLEGPILLLAGSRVRSAYLEANAFSVRRCA